MSPEKKNDAVNQSCERRGTKLPLPTLLPEEDQSSNRHRHIPWKERKNAKGSVEGEGNDGARSGRKRMTDSCETDAISPAEVKKTGELVSKAAWPKGE